MHIMVTFLEDVYVLTYQLWLGSVGLVLTAVALIRTLGKERWY